MLEGPPPPPPKMQRRSMVPTIRSLPAKMPEPDPEEDLISGSSGSDVEPEFESDFIQRPTRSTIPENSNPVYLNSKGQKKATPAYKHDVTTEGLLPSIQLKRIDKDQRSVSPPREEHAKHPIKIQPMYKEKVKPRPKPSPGRDTASKEEVSIWVQIIILLICLLVTVFFLTYVQSTETLPSPPDLPAAPPVTETPVPVDSYNVTQNSEPPMENALPPDPELHIPSVTTDGDPDPSTKNNSENSESNEGSENNKKKKGDKKKKISTSKKTKESQKGNAR